MKCPECVENGQRSKVYSQGSIKTAMAAIAGGGPYWDEDGVWHQHDPNTVISGFSCSNGHSWETRRKPRCPAEGCDYGREPR